MRSFRIGGPFWLTVALLVSLAPTARSHPMGNFSINHYAKIEVHSDTISIGYILDMAEIPTVSERSAMDKNGDGIISDKERDDYLASAAIRLRNGITLRLNGKQAVLSVTQTGLEFLPGAGGLNTTRITLDLAAPLTRAVSNSRVAVEYADANYEARTGWKEIVLAPEVRISVEGSNASQVDLSRQLTVYPTDATLAPPQQIEAHFAIRAALGTRRPLESVAGKTASAALPDQASASNSAGSTPRDAFTQAIAQGNLTGRLILLCIITAFGFGALHALSPGHGKAMMAAYLVGARGTGRHAVILGLVVTVTHTLGVFALGLIMLFAAQHVVPERLYPVLSAASGLTIAIMGAVLLHQRWMVLASPAAANEFGEPSQNGLYDNVPLSGTGSGAPSQNIDQLDNSTETCSPLSVKSLVALGITGGILPCPSALVVMLSAVALHRLAFGMVLIVAFSVGLAVVLTSIGLCVVYMRSLSERISTSGRLVRQLSVISAAFVTAIGLFLVFKSLSGGGY